jgi:hypothetical protein
MGYITEIPFSLLLISASHAWKKKNYELVVYECCFFDTE